MDIPLPQTVPNTPQGGNVLGSMNADLGFGNNYMKNQLMANQVQYAPWTSYADAASKLAYANMLPYQTQATVLGNPMVWMAYNNNPAAMNKMLGNFANTFPSGSSLLSAGGQTLPPPGYGASPRSDGLLSKIVNYLSGNNPSAGNSALPSANPAVVSTPPRNALAQPMVVATPSGNENSGYAYDSSGNDVTASPDQVAAVANNAVNKLNEAPISPQPLPGTGISPNPWFQMKQGESTSGEQGKANVDLWKNQNASDIQDAHNAQATLMSARGFDSAYKKLGEYERGPLFGKAPAVTSFAQIADKNAGNLNSSLEKYLNSNRPTDAQFKMVAKQNPARELNPIAEQSIVDSVESVAQRPIEKIDFDNAAQNMGLTAPQAQVIWTKYINDKPVFDPTTEKAIPDNLNAWQPYLQNADKILRGQYKSGINFNPSYAQSSSGSSAIPSGQAVIQGTKTINGQQYIKVNGGWIPWPQ